MAGQVVGGRRSWPSRAALGLRQWSPSPPACPPPCRGGRRPRDHPRRTSLPGRCRYMNDQYHARHLLNYITCSSPRSAGSRRRRPGRCCCSWRVASAGAAAAGAWSTATHGRRYPGDSSGCAGRSAPPGQDLCCSSLGCSRRPGCFSSTTGLAAEGAPGRAGEARHLAMSARPPRSTSAHRRRSPSAASCCPFGVQRSPAPVEWLELAGFVVLSELLRRHRPDCWSSYLGSGYLYDVETKSAPPCSSVGDGCVEVGELIAPSTRHLPAAIVMGRAQSLDGDVGLHRQTSLATPQRETPSSLAAGEAGICLAARGQRPEG